MAAAADSPSPNSRTRNAGRKARPQKANAPSIITTSSSQRAHGSASTLRRSRQWPLAVGGRTGSARTSRLKAMASPPTQKTTASSANTARHPSHSVTRPDIHWPAIIPPSDSVRKRARTGCRSS